MNLSELMKTRRERLGLTQYDVAEAVSTTVSRISRMERGSELLGFPKSKALARCLKVDHKKVLTAILNSTLERHGQEYTAKLLKLGKKKPARVGEEVARLRYESGLSVRALAKTAEMLPSRIAKVENDDVLVLRADTAARFAEALEVDAEPLVELALQDLLAKHGEKYRVRVR